MGNNGPNPSTFNQLDGDEIEQIINENGGSGEWEQSPEGGKVDRWNFPKFPGAEKPSQMYLSRSGIGEYDTDVETVAGWLAEEREIVGGVMLLGNPGSGKTSLAQAACTHADRDFTVITATPDHTKDALFTKYVGEGQGPDGSPFVLATLVEAAISGKTVIVDEFLLFVDGVKPIFYPLADGNHYLPEALLDGSAAAIHPEFRLIITANPMVRGASLPEPIGSRFASTTLHVETGAGMLRDLGIDESVVAAWEALGTAGLWRPEVRELRMANHWLQEVTGPDPDPDGDGGEIVLRPASPSQAASAFLPEHCPESQRAQIRNTVISFLGGHLRPDGRLVVS